MSSKPAPHAGGTKTYHACSLSLHVCSPSAPCKDCVLLSISVSQPFTRKHFRPLRIWSFLGPPLDIEICIYVHLLGPLNPDTHCFGSKSVSAGYFQMSFYLKPQSCNRYRQIEIDIEISIEIGIEIDIEMDRYICILYIHMLCMWVSLYL